jgi:glycine dehydrogenase subunit 2
MTDVKAPHSSTLGGSQAADTGLLLEERTIFERSSPGRVGFELPPLDVPRVTPARYPRAKPAELPEASELDVVRHFTRLSSWNYSIDSGTFPLGSCTMKYNPRINEEIAAMPGLSEIHPELPAELCQGALEIIYRLEKALCAISGMDDCSVQPAAGAHGEFTGLLVIRAFHEKHGSSRKLVLIPDTAHGTNPASCTLAGYETVTLKSSTTGIVTRETVAEQVEKHGRDIAAMMVTNPNTNGLFESNIVEIAELLHGIGAQLYMDGANMNALLGVAKARDMGVDVMHFNLHKTFSTPHGGGGPGAGPVAVREHLAPYLPCPRVRLKEGRYILEELPLSIGKVKGGLGNFGVVVRALTYMLHHGSQGLKRISRAAVLNANYLRHLLAPHFNLAYSTPSFHECVLTDAKQSKENGVKTLQIAKALIDYGYHPPTIYFPLVVPGAMLVEPTETESIQDLERLANAFIDIARRIQSGEDKFDNAPTKTIVGKVDEVGAARKPVLSLDDRAQ